MSILGIYLLGVVAAALHLVWFEYQFDHNKRLSNVTLKEFQRDTERMASRCSYFSILLDSFCLGNYCYHLAI